jgi:putative ABC transport system permease protein
MRIHTGGQGGQSQVYRRITFEEALAFKERFDFPAHVSVSTFGTGSTVVRYLSRETNPNISVVGSDENYLVTSGGELASGRNFSATELQFGANVAILGSQVAQTLFPGETNPLGEFVTIGKTRYQVIGVLRERGSAFGMSDDLRCILPLQSVRQNFSRPNMNYTISVSTMDIQDLEPGIGEATSMFRVVRGLRAHDSNNFDIAKKRQYRRGLP